MWSEMIDKYGSLGGFLTESVMSTFLVVATFCAVLGVLAASLAVGVTAVKLVDMLIQRIRR